LTRIIAVNATKEKFMRKYPSRIARYYFLMMIILSTFVENMISLKVSQFNE